MNRYGCLVPAAQLLVPDGSNLLSQELCTACVCVCVCRCVCACVPLGVCYGETERVKVFAFDLLECVNVCVVFFGNEEHCKLNTPTTHIHTQPQEQADRSSLSLPCQQDVSGITMTTSFHCHRHDSCRSRLLELKSFLLATKMRIAVIS